MQRLNQINQNIFTISDFFTQESLESITDVYSNREPDELSERSLNLQILLSSLLITKINHKTTGSVEKNLQYLITKIQSSKMQHRL